MRVPCSSLVHCAEISTRSPKRGKSSKKSKRPRSVSSDSSSEEYRRRKEHKEKKKAKKDRERRSRKHDDSESDSDDRFRRDRRSTRQSRSQTRDLPATRSPSPLVAEDEWVVKSVAPPLTALPPYTNDRSPPSDLPSSKPVGDHDGESDEEVGPQPLQKPSTSKRIDERSYGGSLLRGEGSAMAAFLQDGTESRIPRRGEIGLTSDEIAKYEDVGYVMSGSRHRRMNAVRMRKENQVISAEEKRGILKLQKEERERREAILREEFSELVSDRLKGTESRNKI